MCFCMCAVIRIKIRKCIFILFLIYCLFILFLFDIVIKRLITSHCIVERVGNMSSFVTFMLCVFHAAKIMVFMIVFFIALYIYINSQIILCYATQSDPFNLHTK